METICPLRALAKCLGSNCQWWPRCRQGDQCPNCGAIGIPEKAVGESLILFYSCPQGCGKFDRYGTPVNENTKEYDSFRRSQKVDRADKENRVVILPVPIGESIFVICEYIGNNGTKIQDIEELKISGYIKENEQEFYVTYDEEFGSADVQIRNAFSTYKEAKIELIRREMHR